jgi:hypothetical protein
MDQRPQYKNKKMEKKDLHRDIKKNQFIINDSFCSKIYEIEKELIKANSKGSLNSF